MAEEPKVINARVTNDGKRQKLLITFDDGRGELNYYSEPIGFRNAIGYLDVEELIGMTKDDLYYEVRNAMLYHG